jgi:hypothetical protein
MKGKSYLVRRIGESDTASLKSKTVMIGFQFLL